MIFRVSPREQNLLSELPYATLANYSPRGASNLSIQSQNAVGRIKAGDTETIIRAIRHHSELSKSIFRDFLNLETILVPIPRSSPLKEGAIWPSKVIADLLVQFGYGINVTCYLDRERAVPKSSAARSAAERASVQMHYESIRVKEGTS